MPIGVPRRTFVWAILAAIAAGFALGWGARIWYEPSPPAGARETLHELQERARELTR